MLKCLIAFILGWFIARYIGIEGYSVENKLGDPPHSNMNCLNFKNKGSCIGICEWRGERGHESCLPGPIPSECDNGDCYLMHGAHVGIDRPQAKEQKYNNDTIDINGYYVKKSKDCMRPDPDGRTNPTRKPGTSLPVWQKNACATLPELYRMNPAGAEDAQWYINAPSIWSCGDTKLTGGNMYAKSPWSCEVDGTIKYPHCRKWGMDGEPWVEVTETTQVKNENMKLYAVPPK